MIRKAVLFCIGLCSPLLLLGQGQGTHWYFGDRAGLRFDPDGSVTPLDNGRITTFEGCATISDEFGNLLFYTDGIVVYDSTHEPMENGNGLLGDPSSTQSAIIVPKPEDPNIYYIFSVDTSSSQSGTDLGLHYSVIDLSLNNGQGAVIQKNIKLLNASSEKIAAIIKNCFDRSIWVITMAPREKDTFFYDTIHAWEVSTSGVNKFPVKSSFPELYIDDPRGYLKLSPNGDLLASANQTSGLYLFDFDVVSGTSSGYTRIQLPEPYHYPYGIEFSPDGRYLYVHTSNDVLPPRTDNYSLLLQLDLQAPDIESSIITLDSRPIFRGALQLAENGKIYRTISKNYYEGTSFLGVINNPNASGLASDYQHNAVDLGTKITNQGLPPFVQTFQTVNNLIANDDGSLSNSSLLCEGDPFTLQAVDIPGALYMWEKDGVADPSITGFSHTVNSAIPEDTGNYNVEIIPPDPNDCPILGTSYVEVIPDPNSQLDLVQCDYDLANSEDGFARINLQKINSNPNLNFQFYESLADRNNDNPILDPTSYSNTQAFSQSLFYRATNSLGCSSDGQLAINIVPGNIQPAASGPVYSCDSQADDSRLESNFDLDFLAASYAPINVTFYATPDDLAINENALSGILTSESTTLYVRKDDGAQCLGADVLELVVNPKPELNMSNSYSLCNESNELVITAPPGFNEYAWYKTDDGDKGAISFDSSIRISSVGKYRLEARINYGTNGSTTSCTERAKFEVIASEKATITDISIKDFSTNNTVTIEVEGDGDYEYSMNGIDFRDTPFFNKVEPGIHTVYIKDRNGCGITERDITVLGYPKFFTPNGDGVNDFWQITGVNDEFEPDALIAIYDRFGSMVAQISPTSSGWSGKSNAYMYPASDYWFRVTLRNGREFKGHFALKR